MTFYITKKISKASKPFYVLACSDGKSCTFLNFDINTLLKLVSLEELARLGVDDKIILSKGDN
jgi:hypothetical protein